MDASVEIPASDWRLVTEDGSRLMATLIVNGLPLHVEAIEVEIGDGDVQHADERSDEWLALIHDAVGADGQRETLDIGGREYVLIATPFC